MEGLAGLAVVAALLAAVSTFIGVALNWVWFRPKQLEKRLRDQGFSGAPYRFLQGDSKERAVMERMAKSSPISLSDDIVPRAAPFLHHTVQTYGKKSFTWSGPVPFVNITHPECIKDVFTKHYEITKQNANPLVKLLATGVANYEGEKWAKHRKIINPAFHLEKLKSMVPCFVEGCKGMIRKWEQLSEVEGKCEVDVWPHLQELASEIISRGAFASNYEEGKRIFDLCKEQCVLTSQVLQSFYIPGWRFLPTRTNIRMKQIDKEVKTSLHRMIKRRARRMEAGEDRIDDLLGSLMESNQTEVDGKGKGTEVQMSANDVIEECKLFYLAGQETTSSMLVWTMVLLARHQNWQTQARNEATEVFGGSIPSFDSLNRLKVIPMILYETIRLYPPVIQLTRAAQGVNIREVMLPAGVHISLPIIMVHRDPELWGDDALEFKPERFSGGISKAATKQISFFPFGGGPRICIGMNFSLLEAKLAIAMILQRFSFELSPCYVHAPHSVVTLQPQHGAHFILRRI